jgi:hypothetical protein
MTVKEIIHKIIDQQPDDSSFEDILKELTFNNMIRKGIDDVRNGQVLSQEEVRKEIDSW